MSRYFSNRKFSSFYTAFRKMSNFFHSQALKDAIIAHWHNGLSYSQIVTKISKGTVGDLVAKFRKTGSTENLPRSGAPQTARTPERINATRMKTSQKSG